MKAKAVVKVMNFHALLRVDSSSKQALKYQKMQNELTDMIQIILNNKNFKLDKLIMIPKTHLPKLRIYLGTDLGFCGGINTNVSQIIMSNNETKCENIIIGKKLNYGKNVVLRISKDEYHQNFDLIRDFIVKAVKGHAYSSIDIVYNHYYDTSTIKTEVKQIYPLQIKENKELKKFQWDDFEIDSSPQELLEEMIISCLIYELKTCEASSYAAENIMRQNATSESLKKLDEMEIEEIKASRKAKNQKQFKKTIDSFTKQKSLKEV